MEIAMTQQPVDAGYVESQTPLSEGDQQCTESPIVGAGDSCDDGITNNEGCEVSKNLVNDVPDPPNHKLTAHTNGGLTDSAVDVSSTDINQQSDMSSSNFFTGNLLEMLMSNMNDDRVETGDVSVHPEGGTSGDSVQDVDNTSRDADSSMTDYDNTRDGMAKRESESSFGSNKLIGDTIDKCTTNEQLDDDSTTRTTLNEQRCDSPSSGISSCSVVTAGYLEEKLNTLVDDCVADTTPQCVRDEPAESTRDSCNLDDNIRSPGDVELAPSDSHYSDDDPIFVLPGETFDVLRTDSSEIAAGNLENRRDDSPHGASDDAFSDAHRSSIDKITESSEDVPDTLPETTLQTSLEALSRQYGVDLSENRDDTGHVTCATNDGPVNGAGVDKHDHACVRLASSLSSDSDAIPCGSRHSTNDGKQYVNLPMSPLHRDGTHKDSHVIVRNATVKQGGRPGSHIKVQVELGDKERGKLNRYDVHRLLERGGSRWQCDRHKGPHIVLMALLFMPVALVVSTAFSLYTGTICWYNVLCYMYIEGAALHKALFCPLLVLTYPISIFATAFGVGLYASVIQVSWSLVRWQQKVTDYEKGFYGWLCTALGIMQCAPYGVIVLNADVAQTLEAAQDETEV